MKNIRLFTIMCFALISLIAVTTKGVNASEIMQSKTGVDPHYDWTIKFSMELDGNTLDKIQVRDAAGLIVNTKNQLLADEKSVKVFAPEQGYTNGKTYTLEIQAVKSKFAHLLKNTTTMSFTIKDAESDPQLIEGLTEKEQQLAKLLNEYRESKGLKALPISKSLTEVARAHVKDSNAYSPENGVDERGVKCNLHSWSANGKWSSVCYTSDHEYASNMWDKPRELTDYKGDGFEISVGYSSSVTNVQITPEQALKSWQGSQGHNDVIIGKGYWLNLTTMGVAIDGKYAHVWFGTVQDPSGYY